uniref:Uncharacterized protein n=1 Tax=Anguilla anguilla TaxID=7936 RepID=A0A0E9WFC5_ANGAN
MMILKVMWVYAVQSAPLLLYMQNEIFLSLMPSSMAALHSLCILSLNHWIFAETIQVWCLGGTSAVLFLRLLPTDICY